MRTHPIQNLLLAMILLWLSPAALGATVLVLGDSISAGYGIPSESGWVALLERHLDREYPREFQVINASVSGETTAGGRYRLPDLLEEHEPELVIIELGGNDGLRGLSLDRMRENLQTMVRESTAHDSEVVLLGVNLPASYGVRFRRLYEAVFEEIADAEEVTYAPMGFADLNDRDLLQSDGVHPTEKAQPILFTKIWATIGPVIARISKASSEAH